LALARPSAALLAALALGPAIASAARTKVAVVPFSAGPDLAYTGEGLARAVAAAAAGDAAVEVIGPEEIADRLGPVPTRDLVRCADDARCLADRAAALGADRVIGGRIHRDGAIYRVVAVNADARSGAAVARLERAIPVASRRLVVDVVSATPALLRGDASERGVLRVETEAPGADVAVDGAPAGRTPLALDLAPGKHEVQVTRPAHLVQEPRWVEVPRGGEVVVRPRLQPVPARERPAGTTSTTVEVAR
jgi:hypothetical protein